MATKKKTDSKSKGGRGTAEVRSPQEQGQRNTKRNISAHTWSKSATKTVKLAGAKAPAKAKSTAPVAPPVLENLSIKAIIPHPQNPRTFPKKDKDDKTLVELADSIKGVGLLEPVLVRPFGDGYQLLAGERRLRASRLAGLDTIAAIVRDLDDHAALEVLVTENLQRENLHPLEEARGVRALMEGAGWTARDVADKLGKSAAWVAQRSRLTVLSEAWQNAIADPDSMVSRWPIGHLILVAKLEPAAQDDLARHHEFLGEDDQDWIPEREEIQRLVADRLRTLRLAPWNLKDEGLCAEAGSCVTCKKRSSCHPGLFDDEDPVKPSATDRCLDPLCWDEKARRFLAMREAQLRATHPDLVLVHREHVPQGQQDGALRSYDFSPAKKGEAKAKPALVLDGKGAGTVMWIQPHVDRPTGRTERPKDADGKTVPSSLADRRAGLEKRRKVKAVEFIVKAIKGITPFPKPAHIVDPLLHLLLPLAAVFGTQYREDSSQVARDRSYEERPNEGIEQNDAELIPQDAEDLEEEENEALGMERWNNPQIVWSGLFRSLTDDPQACARTLWNQVRPVLVQRLAYQGTPTNVAKLWADAEQCCQALGINADAALAAAIEAIPEPKAWAKLKEDGTPKGSSKAVTEEPQEASA